jgi:hypothetical protein
MKKTATNLKSLWIPLVATAVAAALAGCGKTPDAEAPKAAAAEAKPKLGIRPYGDETVKIDMAQVHNEDLKKVFEYIDTNIDDHVVNLQKWIQQPSISNTGEGMQESAEMVKGFFDQLGCQESKVYDVGITEWGQQGNPVVYAKCDEGADKTLVVYWMYDTMPVTQPDLWKAPPFEAQLVEQGQFKKVLIGRGATNSKGRQMAFYNAMMSIKAVTGKLPVNLIFVAEGDEERMSMGYRKFVRENKALFEGADAMWGGGGSEGCLFVELITSGEKWGPWPELLRHPRRQQARRWTAPAWRHIKMLSTLGRRDRQQGHDRRFLSRTSNRPPRRRRSRCDETARDGTSRPPPSELGVARYISDDPYMQSSRWRSYETSINLDGIWGGNMFAGGSGAILPNKHDLEAQLPLRAEA